MLFYPPLLNPLTLTAIGGYYFMKVPAKSRPKGPSSKLRMGGGNHKIVREKIRLVDSNRSTQAHENYRGHHNRTLKGEIIRPARLKEPGPLLVYNHGFMSNYGDGEYLMRFLAGRGYTVVGVNYPLTNTRAPGAPYAPDLVNQPADISFIIDEILKRSATPGDSLFNTIDAKSIALAGVSLGGLTSLLTAYHRGLKDDRIAAVICIAGPTDFLSEDFFVGSDVPTLMIYGDKDSLVEYERHAIPGREKIPGAVLVTLKNGSHTGFAQQSATYLRYLKNPDSIACHMIPRAISKDQWTNVDFLSVPEGTDVGIVEPGEFNTPPSPLVRVSMKAARQQMYTNLAAHAFLDSHFSNCAVAREDSRNYLVDGLTRESGDEVDIVH